MSGTDWDSTDEGSIDRGPGSAEPRVSEAGLPTEGPVVPGMTVQSPAMDYVLGRQRRRRRHAAATAAAVLAIVVVAAVITAVAHKSRSHTTMSAELTAAQVIDKAAQQQGELRSLSGTFSMQLSGSSSLNATVTGSLKEQRQPLRMAIASVVKLNGQSVQQSEIVTSSALYLKIGAVPAMPSPIGSKWIKIPLTGSLSPSITAVERQLQSEIPTSQTRMLRSMVHIHPVGTPSVGGVRTTEYSGSVDPAVAIRFLPADMRAYAGPDIRKIDGNIRVNVWIDGQGRLRKMTVGEQISQGLRPTVHVSLSFMFGSFNKPVNITLPRARQI